MKKFTALLALVFLAVVQAKASTIVYQDDIIDSSPVSIDRDYVLDLQTAGSDNKAIDTVTAEAVCSSATVTPVTFTDGSLSSGYITVASTANLLGTAATNQITINSTSTLTNSYVTINGKKLRNGYEWKTKATVALTAADLARILNYVTGIQASSSAGVVYCTATVTGTAANSYTLTASTTAITVASARFTGGLGSPTVSINGVNVTFTPGATTALTAKAISDGIMANSNLNTIIQSTYTGSVVYATATTVGVHAYPVVCSPAASLVRSGATFTGGTASATSLSATINYTAHGLNTGLAVLYTTGSATALDPLVDGTTYYAISVNSNSFKLASSKLNAIAGTAIVMTSSSTTGAHSFTLTPLTISGTFGYKWQQSDNGIDYLDISVDSVTFATPFASTTTSWNLGYIGHRYLRLHYTAGTYGATDLAVTVTGRNTGSTDLLIDNNTWQGTQEFQKTITADKGVDTTTMTASGAITANGGVAGTGNYTMSGHFVPPLFDVAVTSPAYIGELCRTAAGDIYRSTDSLNVIQSWLKLNQ